MSSIWHFFLQFKSRKMPVTWGPGLMIHAGENQLRSFIFNVHEAQWNYWYKAWLKNYHFQYKSVQPTVRIITDKPWWEIGCYLQNKSDVNRINTLSCPEQSACRVLRLWHSRDREAIDEASSRLLCIYSGDCVFTLIDKSGIMEFGLFKLNLTLKIKVSCPK